MDYYKTLEFDEILRKLSDCAVSQTVKERCLLLEPVHEISEAKRLLNDTTQAKQIIEQSGTPPLPAMFELKKIIEILNADDLLNPEQFEHVLAFFTSCRRLKDYLKKAES